MTYTDAKQRCPDIVLVPQNPDLYRRAHNTLIAEISTVLPIEAVKSIDEITCRLDVVQEREPLVLGRRIKDRIAQYVGPHITCSIGFAANRHLAKMAGKQNKPDGMTIWHPDDIPSALYSIPLDAVSTGTSRHHHN